MYSNLGFVAYKRILFFLFAVFLVWIMMGPLSKAHATNLVDSKDDNLNFTHSGSISNALNTSYRYNNVMTGVDAITGQAITVDAIVTYTGKTGGAVLEAFDNDPGPNANVTSDGADPRLQPTLKVSSPTDENNYALFKVEFIKGGTNEDVYLKNFRFTVIDLDGGGASAREFVEISGYEDVIVSTANQFKKDGNGKIGVYDSTTGRTRFTGISTSLSGLSFDNSASFIANYTVPTRSLTFAVGYTASVSTARLFSLSIGKPLAEVNYGTNYNKIENTSSASIDAHIEDPNSDGYLDNSELGNVRVYGNTVANATVFINVADNAGTPHSANYITTANANGDYEINADLTGYTGTIAVKASVTDSQGNPGVATDSKPVNNVPEASSVSVGGNPVIVGNQVTGQYSLTDPDGDAAGGAGGAQDRSTYKWYIGTQQDGSDKTEISSQTAKTYTIQETDYGKYLFFEVTPKVVVGKNPGTAVASAGAKVTKKPVANPQTVWAYEGVPVAITLTGYDEDVPVTQLVYNKTSSPQHGTLTEGSNSTQWSYTAVTESTTESFTFTVTDGDSNVSSPATVTINVYKSLDGWVGGSQAITSPLTIGQGQSLLLSAVSSVEADSVTASVYGTTVSLSLSNAATFITDGFKKWGNTAYVLPGNIPANTYSVTFAVYKGNEALPNEPSGKLLNNSFNVIAAPIADSIDVSVNKGLEVIFTQSNFSQKFKDASNNPATLQQVKIVSLPSLGTLLYNNNPVAAGDEIPAANLGQLKFVPAQGQTGTVTFNWNGYDGLQYAASSNVVTIKINTPPVVGDIQKTGLMGATIAFTAADFTGTFTDADMGDMLQKVKVTLPGDFAAKGILKYTSVGNAVYVNPGSYSEIYAVDLASLNFQPDPGLTADTLVLFKWEGFDGKQYSENQANITITYNGKPIAIPQTVTLNEGASLQIGLKGTDAETVTGLVYGIQTQPAHGSLSPVGGNVWTYTPNANYSGTDSFTFTVTDADHQVSIPATVNIKVTKLLDGWAGSKEQGDTAVVKGMRGQSLPLFAVSSVDADAVEATVNGTIVALSLTNAGTYATEGFKRWAKTDYMIPLNTPANQYLVAFTAKAGGALLQSEPQNRLGDNSFEIVGVSINLTANPNKIIGDGRSTTNLTTTVKDVNGNPIAGVEVVFAVPTGAGNGVFPNSDRAVTDAQGQATVLYQSSKITGVDEKQIPITATVNDPVKGLYAQDQIMVVFQPASISGVITKGGTNEPVPNATVRVTLDLNNDGIFEFDQTVHTDASGAYSVIVPKGDVDYNLQVTQTVKVGNVETPVTYTQKAHVGEVTGGGSEDFNSEKTVTGIVLFKQTNGQTALMNDDMVGKMKVYLKDAAGNYIMDGGVKKPFELQASGVFSADGLTLGDYTLEISYEVASGQEIIVSRGNVSVKANGEMNITEELVDPYGTVTDSATHAVLPDAQITLYFADTARNRNKGRTPGTGVVLPAIAGFEPNNNASPGQTTNADGLYAYMVFPETDYYLVVTKNGYSTYISPTIPVEFDIVKHDVKLTRYTSSSSGSSYGSYSPTDSGVSLNLSTDKNLVKEGDNVTLTVEYKNGSANTLSSSELKITLPEGVALVDADGGKVEGNVITWTITDLNGGQSGSRKVVVKPQQISGQDASFKVAGEFITGQNATAAVSSKSEVKVQVFSDRYGELSHQRYILGYPDGLFKPDRSLSRAELAAIVARLTENEELTDPISYSDVKPDHWAANYIRIVTKYGYFNGFEDGTFRPEEPVTRGELVSVMARFLKLNVSEPGVLHFNDINGHWAAAAIEELYRSKYLSGYPDGTFKPQNNIIRSEAVTLVNRMLYRGPLKGLKPLFPDISESHWAYGDVQEATLSHEASRNTDGSEAFLKTIPDLVK